jgi:hypothetical protein
MTSKLDDLHGRILRLRDGLDGLDLRALKTLLDELEHADLESLDETTISRLLNHFHALGIHWAGSHSQSLLTTYVPVLEALTSELSEYSPIHSRSEALVS